MRSGRSHPLGLPTSSGAGFMASGSRGASVTALDRWLARKLVAAAGDAPVEVELWDGEVAHRAGPAPVGRLVFRDRGALLTCIFSPELGVGDSYAAGRLEIEGDLVSTIAAIYQAIETSGPRAFKRDLLGRLPRARRNTRDGSRAHIHHHYDLGNDFYRLWLDERMVYTCAYYPSPEATLEQAQVAKLDHVCRKLRLRPGQRVVEAGCGWGALALHMAAEYGVSVRAFNISAEQVAFARERARALGLDARVEFVEDDYRNISGRFDAFVSVGMLEHVGLEHYEELGAVIDRALATGGMGLVHSVGRSRPAPPNAWLEARIFPGSHPPSLGEMMRIFEPYRLDVLDVENLRLHYARTLTEWLARFDRHLDGIRATYDDFFVRAWRLYLAGCAAAFRASTIQLFQVVFSRASNNALPCTRAHLYGADGPLWAVK
ncbi:MAG: class I SAM-dependent methyltransferase [Ectothiorhodospiraceae bacterium]|nr:class I SAM-dependent methyltransferase [Ectothiorhodospiraceae bacterium]